MGVYNTKYRDYLSHNHAVRTYVNLKTEFSAEQALQNERNMTTSQASCHAANAATDKTNASNITPELNQSVTHFTEASIEAFQQLKAMNAELQPKLAYLQTHMINMSNTNKVMVPMEQQTAY